MSSRSIPAPSRAAAPPGSRPSAARMEIQGLRPLLRRGRVRSGKRLARRSNSAASQRAEPIFIPASPQPANGISRPAMPSSPTLVARSRMRTARTCVLASGATALSCRNSSPGAIPRRCADSLLGQLLLQRRPARGCLPLEALRIGGEGIPVVLAAKQIKPLSRDQPEPGVTGIGDAPRQIDRVVASELGPVNIRMGNKRSAIAFVAEAPDRACLGRLELRQPDHGAGIDKIGDGVETLYRKTRVAVHDDPLGRRGLGRER